MPITNERRLRGFVALAQTVHCLDRGQSQLFQLHRTTSYSNTTVYYGIHELSQCIPVDSGVTNLIHDCRSCVDFTLEVEANVA